MSWNEFDRQMNKGPGHAIMLLWRIGILILILVGITTCGVWVVTKPFGVVADTLDSDNVKYNYEWFKNTHESINALESQIKTARRAVVQFKAEAGPRNTWHREDREDYARLNAVLQGLRNQRASVAADYNARSRQVNRAIFKGTDTPTRIPVDVSPVSSNGLR